MSEQQDPRAIRDARQAAIGDVLADPLRLAIENNLPSQALERCALEDVNAVIDAVVETLDETAAVYLLTHADALSGTEATP